MVDLLAALHPHTRLGLDTSVFIYHIESESPFSLAAGEVLHQLRLGTATGVTSVVTLTEILVKPLQVDRLGLAARYEMLIRAIPNLHIVDIDARVARHAAVLRARYRLRTADALQVAAALDRGATAFVTNDARLRRVEDLHVIVLADLSG